MKAIPKKRYLTLSGSAFNVGFSLGKTLQETLAKDIEHYIQTGPIKFGSITLETIQMGAMNWYEGLPKRFQAEMAGMAQGSGVPLQRIAEWGFADAGGGIGCSGFMLRDHSDIWIGRNNDLWVPDLWGYAIQRKVTGRLGVLTFGMRGELFAATGLNEAGLWLHYNWLPTFNTPSGAAWTPYVLLTEILETCGDVDEVEALLKGTVRTGGMLIFAAQGEGSKCALFECAPQEMFRQDLQEDFLAGTNHYQWLSTPQSPSTYAPESAARLKRLKALIANLPESPKPQDLISILADPDVEQHQPDYGTVTANLCSPTKQALWFTFGGGFPAASQGRWAQIPWPY